MLPDTYATLINKKLLIPSQKTSYVAIDRAFFTQLFLSTARDIYVDEDWYLAHSPDVKEAIDHVEFASATDHFVRVGYFEHRMPYEIEVDENWYLDNYGDVAAAVEKSVFASGRAHFYLSGYREGRFPHPNFVLRSVNSAASLN